jgi:hypothetical protein
MRGRLNVFQRTMLRFRELHPYNAVHVVDIAAPLDSTHLAATIDDELFTRGITRLALDPSRRRFEYAAGPGHASLRSMDGESDPLARLAVEIETELNTPFDAPAGGAPIRFFAIKSGDRFRLGLVYDHFIAGGDAIVALLASIAKRYVDRDAAVDAPPPLYPPTYRHLLRRRPLDALRALGALPALIAGVRRAARPRFRADDDHYNAFLLVRLDAASTERLTACTRSWGVTRNDLLLAALMLAVAPLAQKRWQARRRRELAVASIVNLRREFGAAGAAFGQFLSSFRVSHAVAPDIDLETLARAVHAQTAAIKRRRLHLRTILALGLAGAAWPFLEPVTRHRFFTKHHPVWGAITMLDVNALWPGGSAPPDYVRGVPTGPLAPLVVAATPVGNRMNLGFTFRTACYSRAAAEQIAADVVHRFDPLKP